MNDLLENRGLSALFASIALAVLMSALNALGEATGAALYHSGVLI